MRYCLCFVLLFAVIFCGVFSVSAYAAEPKLFSYNGFVAPALPENEFSYAVIFDDSLVLCSVSLFSSAGQFIAPLDDGILREYDLIDGNWVFKKETIDANAFNIIGYTDLIWSNHDLYTSDNQLVLARSAPGIIVEPISLSELDPFLNAYGDQISVKQVVIVLAAAAGVSVGLVFLWWGTRKVTGALMKAFKKGKFRI